MRKLGLTVLGVLTVVVVLFGIDYSARNVTAAGDYKVFLNVVQKQAGPTATATAVPVPTSTPFPIVTATPYPTPTPGGPFDYVVQRIYRLNACENHGMLRAHIRVFGPDGALLDGVHILRYTSAGDYAGEARTGDKGPGAAEFSLEAENGGNWNFFVDVPGTNSEIAWNIRTDIGLWEECDDPRSPSYGQPGVYFKHVSYDIDFRKVR